MSNDNLNLILFTILKEWDLLANDSPIVKFVTERYHIPIGPPPPGQQITKLIDSLLASQGQQEESAGQQKAILQTKDFKIDWARTFDVTKLTELRLKNDVKQTLEKVLIDSDNFDRIEYAGEWSNPKERPN